MDDAEIATLVRSAGLERVAARFPDEVRPAILAAEQSRAVLATLGDRP